MNKPIPFSKKDSETRYCQICSWFINDSDINRAIQGEPLTEGEAVGQEISDISSACVNDNVDIKVRRYFDNDVWIALQHVHTTKKKNNNSWTCEVCKDDLEIQNSSLAVACER